MSAPLWRVESGKGRTWLFGDHAVRHRGWLTTAVCSAIDSASALWIEVPEENPVTNPRLAELGFSSDGDLEDSLGPVRWQRAVELARSVGVDLPVWRAMRPWLAAQMMDSAFMSAHDADEHRPGAVLSALARSRGIEIRSEFTMDEALNFYSALPLAAELAFADTVFARVEAGREGLEAESDAWLAGRSDLCEEYIAAIRARSDELADAIGLDRNRAWLPRIETALADGEDHFVLVGFGHLAGPDRIQVHLENAGLNVERIE